MPFGRRNSERRRAPRDRRPLSATIEFGSAPPVKCIVLDHSEGGALLELHSILGIPDQFHVRIAGRGSRLAEVFRRAPKRLAVRFI